MKSNCSRSDSRAKPKMRMNFRKFKDHEELASRLKKTFYYGKQPTTDRPSHAMTRQTVDIFSKYFPHTLDQLDMEYASNLSRNACVSPCSLMLALVYIERLRHCNPDYLQKVSSSEIFLVSLLVASKFLHDEGEDDEVFNDEWGASGDIETDHVNRLEREFLAALDWNVFVSKETLQDVQRKLEARIAFCEAVNRGWFSYTDLDILSSTTLAAGDCVTLLLESICKVVLVCSVAYASAMLTLVGAACVVQNGVVPSLPPTTVLTSTSSYSSRTSTDLASVDLPYLDFHRNDSNQKTLPWVGLGGHFDVPTNSTPFTTIVCRTYVVNDSVLEDSAGVGRSCCDTVTSGQHVTCSETLPFLHRLRPLFASS